MESSTKTTACLRAVLLAIKNTGLHILLKTATLLIVGAVAIQVGRATHAPLIEVAGIHLASLGCIAFAFRVSQKVKLAGLATLVFFAGVAVIVATAASFYLQERATWTQTASAVLPAH